MTVQTVTTIDTPANDLSLVTLEDIKAELKINDADTSNDEWLNRSIGQVSTSIASYCNRRFQRETIQRLVGFGDVPDADRAVRADGEQMRTIRQESHTENTI